MMETFISALSGKEFPVAERVSGRRLSSSLLTKVKQELPEFGMESFIAESELNVLKLDYLAEHLEQEVGDLNDLEQTVLDSIGNHKQIVTRPEDSDSGDTFGQRIADKVATFGGSWRFIISFSVVLVLWIFANALLLRNKGFDPYPFILLNLILSCLAALQAPVIMMSQNRQEEKDRERARNDYMINLKSELEIRMLHEKIDHLIMRHQEDIIELQKSQLDHVNALIAAIGTNK